MAVTRETPAAYELTVAGRKLAGSAQTRRAGSILQHGAIPLTAHAERLAALGRITRAELITTAVVLGSIVFWATDRYHHLPSFLVGMFGLTVVALCGKQEEGATLGACRARLLDAPLDDGVDARVHHPLRRGEGAHRVERREE